MTTPILGRYEQRDGFEYPINEEMNAMPDEPYDWVDDDSMSEEETMRRFEAGNPVETTGPHSVGIVLTEGDLHFSGNYRPALSIQLTEERV
jgi:hypothetical protein